MTKLRAIILFLIPAAILLGFGFLASAEKPPPQSGAFLEPALARALASASPDDFLPVIVVLKEQERPERWAGAGEKLVAGLKAFAAEKQGPLRSYLDEARAAGLVEAYTPFWIFNGFALKARPGAIRQIASHPSVSVILLDHYRQLSLIHI